MEAIDLRSYRLETDLTGYLPVPRELLEMDLPSTAVLLYGVLLDRGTLSRKNQYADPGGHIYVYYPIEHLARTLHISNTAVKRHLRELEQRGLLRRRRERKNAASQIYLYLPSGSIQGRKRAAQSPEMPPSSGRKVPPNNRKEQQNISNYYQHGEEESL